MIQNDKEKVRHLSVPVKILLTAGLTYLIFFLSTTWATLHFGLDLNTLYFGFSLKKIFLFSNLLLTLLAFCVATYAFFDRPLIHLTQIMSKAGEGDFLIRAEPKSGNEIGTLAEHFNQMLMKITDLSAHKIQSDHDLIVAQEELKYKKQLEEKGRIIQKTNRSLENIIRDLSLLYEIGQSINQTIEVSELYAVITNVLKKHLRLSNFSLMVWDEKQGLLQIKAAFGLEDSSLLEEMTFQAGEGIAGEVLKTGKTVYVEEVGPDFHFAKKEIKIQGSLLSVPLNYKGSVLGVANFGREQTNAFSPHDIKMLTLVANQIALAIANAKLYTQTRELSVTDELTRVFNRRHFNQVLQLEWKRVIRFKRDLSLLMMDVDYFKKYNDTYGHPKGDEALKKMGRLLNAHLREVDTVARFGGEEFVVLLPDTDKHGAMAVAEKLRHLVQEGIEGITVSMGVTNFPEDAQEMDDLIDHADIALYDAKDQGRNRVVLYQAHHKSPALKTPDEEKEKGTSKTRFVH